jgi:hypothetical protein
MNGTSAWWIVFAAASGMVVGCGDPGGEGGTGLQRVASAVVEGAPECGSCADTDYCFSGQCTEWLGFLGACTGHKEPCYGGKGLCVDHPTSPSGPLCHPTCVVTVANDDCGPPKNGITETCFFFSQECGEPPVMLCVRPQAVTKAEGQVCIDGPNSPHDCAPGLHCVRLVSPYLTAECRYFCRSDADCAWQKPGSKCALCSSGNGFCRP